MRTRAIVFVGVACAGVGAILVLGVIGAAKFLEPAGPGTVSGGCEGGSYAVTLAMGPGAGSAEVMAQVVVHDDEARPWQVRWYGWEDQFAVAEIKTEADEVSQVFQPLGDLDDGDTRPVWIRPKGVRDWCKVNAHLG